MAIFKPLKPRDVVLYQRDDGKLVMIDISSNGFIGIVRSDSTAAFIVDQLRSETKRDEILDKILDRYDAPRKVMG